MYGILDFAVKKAKESGADGIIGLRIDIIDNPIAVSEWYLSSQSSSCVQKIGHIFIVTRMAKRK